jgi:glycosyltransferase involved in cell wall biosynthesis
MDIRDWWMFEYQQRSPFRDFFHWSLMPTVDAKPQNPQWINTFDSADSIFTYSEFGRDVLKSQCDSVKFIDIASPAASDDFYPIKDKEAHKSDKSLDSKSIIVGTVMRNQRRKLYPDLFKAFRMFLDETKNSNVFLYTHKYYPDIGWETPQLLDHYGLNNRVLFSYQCTKCKDFSVDFYKDSVGYCKECKKFAKKLVGQSNSIDQTALNKVYNLFDVYVQYANSEGFGMPQLEAAKAGVPVMATNYSAMESIIKNIDGIPLNPLALTMECETGAMRAVPDNQNFVNTLKKYVNDFEKEPHSFNYRSELSSNVKKIYNWDKTAKKWIDYFKTVPMKDWSETWNSPAQIKTPATDMPSDIVDMKDIVNYLFRNVLHKPEWIGGFFWSKVIKDCIFGYRAIPSEDDYYFNESHATVVDKYQPYSLEEAVKDLVFLRDQWNKWEKIRSEI